MEKKKEPISYAIIRFQPHVETEEFANVGIVLLAPRSGFLDFRLEVKRVARITGFFESIEPAFVKNILKSYQFELLRIRTLAGFRPDGQTRFEFNKSGNAEHLFDSLTKDREGILRFSDVRFAMHDDPGKKIE